MEKVKGYIDDLTENSIKIKPFWYKFFETGLLAGINKGDFVELSFQKRIKDNKTYRNAKDIRKIQVEKELKDITRKDLVNIQKIDTTTINSILMSATSITVAYQNNCKEFTDINLVFNNAVKLLTDNYNRLKTL